MNRLKKHFLFIYLVISIVVISILADKFVLTSSSKIYQFIPAESDIVIEVNSVNFVKEVTRQWIYQPDHFDKENLEFETEDLVQKIEDIGIDPFSKVLVFNERWANESLWFGVVKVENESDFSIYVAENFPHAIINYGTSVAIVQMSQSNNQEEVSKHIDNILAGKVSSIADNPLVKRDFSDQNELNIFLKSVKSDYVTDGYLSVNFNDTQIDIEGFFHPIGDTEVEPVDYAMTPGIGVSLRSSLNLLNTIYLFNNTKLEHLPDYKQLAFDYDGVNLLTNNDVIPVTSFPNINLSLDIDDEEVWRNYLEASIEDESLIIAGDTMMINSEVKAKVRFKVDQNKFELYQNPKTFVLEENDHNNYFNLIVHPAEIVKKMTFKKDEDNPPKIIASQIIKIVKSVLDDFSYLSEIDEINFRIDKDEDTENYVSTGHIIYHNRNSHSTIQSYYLFKNFVRTFGALLR